MNKNFSIALLLVVSPLLIVSFQNCSQPGSLGIAQDPGYLAKNAGDPANNNGEELEVIPVDVADDLMVPPIVSDEQGTIVDPDTGVVISNPKPPVVVVETPKPVDPPKSDDPSQPVIGNGDPNLDPSLPGGYCYKKIASDILLRVTNVDVNQVIAGSRDHVEIIGSRELSLLQPTIQIRALKPLVNVKSLRIDFDPAKSFLVDQQKIVYYFHAPSAESSGLKFELSEGVSLNKGQMYNITIKLDLDKQMVASSKKCIFKPVIKMGLISPASP